MRPIDADAFKDDLDYICGAGGCLEPVTTAVITFVQKMIVRQPTIEPRAKGGWIMEGTELKRRLRCSCCSSLAIWAPYAMSFITPNFCPNCGADMRQEEKDGKG